MGILSVYHPDIFEFVEAKSKDPNRLKHFNLSVMVDDAFMEAVESGGNITLHWPICDDRGNKLPESEWDPQFTKTIPAAEVWDKIMRMAYDTGEPGIFFEDTLQRMNPANYLENITGTNPCSEYLAGTIKKEDCDPQDFGGACNLGSLYLHNFVENPFTPDAKINYKLLKETINTAVRMLDDIIDVNTFPDKIYENYQKNMRTIGLGYTGLADMLAMLGMRYDSQEAREFVGRLMAFCADIAYLASTRLAEERGTFPFCDKEKHAKTEYVRVALDPPVVDEIKKHGLRNAKIFAVAPTGTTSMAYGNNCSSGIEPIFQLDYERKIHVGGQEDDNIQVVHMTDYAYKMWQDMGAPEAYKDVWVTALDMSVDDHIDMLSTIVPYVDMSVSKTINIPTEYSFEDTKDVYMKCWKRGVKGCTIFRPNALRQGILISNDSKEKAGATDNGPSYSTTDDLPRGMIIGVDDDLNSIKKTVVNGCGKFYLHVDFDDDINFLETYIDIGSGGGCERNLQFISRLMSLALRAGVPLEAIIDQANSIRPCKAFTDRTKRLGDTSPGTSCPSAIGKALEAMKKKAVALYGDADSEESAPAPVVEPAPKKPVQTPEKPDAFANMPKCPECGAPMKVEGGCACCSQCSYTKCG